MSAHGVTELPGVNPDALPAGVELVGQHELVLYVLDVLERVQDTYRASDLPRLKPIYGEPALIPAEPVICVIPSDADSTHGPCTKSATRMDQVVLRWWLRTPEGNASDNAYPLVTRTGDWLRALFYANSKLQSAEGAMRVRKAWPGQTRVRDFIAEDRAGNVVGFARGGEITLTVKLTEDLGDLSPYA
jgi:hypothetical protein